MDPVNIIKGGVSDLNRDDVDTDQIIPARFMKRVERTGYGEFLFFDAKQAAGFHVDPNPILTTGQNFGCGSSREHAPWALEDFGFRAIVAPSLADIFASNSTKVGLLPVVLAEDEVRKVAAAGEAEINLEAQTITAGGETFSFPIDADTKYRLINGLDEIGQTLAEADKIEAYEATRERTGPVTTSLPAEQPLKTLPIA
jgi:3-isopropylmalate/(R)-2-methylmalate dehydratase small subunit